MAACAQCGTEFTGTPWRYGPAGREHVDCGERAPQPAAVAHQQITHAEQRSAAVRTQRSRQRLTHAEWMQLRPDERARLKNDGGNLNTLTPKQAARLHGRSRKRGSRHGGKPPAPKPKAFAARFPGTCTICLQPVHPGERIIAPKWNHIECETRKGGGC